MFGGREPEIQTNISKEPFDKIEPGNLWRDEMGLSAAASAVGSPPPCGEGLGVGATTSAICNWGYPPPQPSPTRGEGAHFRRGDRLVRSRPSSNQQLRLPGALPDPVGDQ